MSGRPRADIGLVQAEGSAEAAQSRCRPDWQVIRRHVLARRLSPEAGAFALKAWRRLGVRRHAVVGSLGRMWTLRDNLTAYDAAYVALAERLGCPLVTTDARLAGAPGIACSVSVLPA